MWHTSRGDRVLTGKERFFFVRAVAWLLNDLLDESHHLDPRPEHACSTGVPLFDRQDVTARIALLRDLVQALTDPAVPMPELTAANEAAVYAVFLHVRDEIELEVDIERDLASLELEAGGLLGGTPDLHHWRTLVLDAYREVTETDGATRDGMQDLDAADDDMDEWWARLEALANQIVWDRDWELEGLIVDDAPERACRVKEEMGIAPDYFVAMPGLLTEGQVREAVAFVRQVARERSSPAA